MILRSVFGRISTVVLSLALLPLSGISFFAYYQAKVRMTRDVVAYFLEKVASDTASKLNAFLHERDMDIQTWVRIPTIAHALQQRNETSADRLRSLLNSFVTIKGVYELIAVFDAAGSLLATNDVDADQSVIDPGRMQVAFGRGVETQPWFQGGLVGRFV